MILRVSDFFIDDFPSYLDAYLAVVPVSNLTDYNIGGRLISRLLLETNITAVMTALKFVVSEGAGVSGVSVNVSSYPLDVTNSVNPVWRSSIYSLTLGLYVL